VTRNHFDTFILRGIFYATYNITKCLMLSPSWIYNAETD